MKADRLKSLWFMVLFLPMLVIGHPALEASGERVLVTIIKASTEDDDMDLDNDIYRDEMIRLFSYTSYKQIDQGVVMLETRGEAVTLELPKGYRLVLTLEEAGESVTDVWAAIRSGGTDYVDTLLSLKKPGVVFLGGPPLENGNLIIVLEMGY